MKIKNILISQPKPDSEKSPYYDIIRNHKVSIEFKPFIHVEGVPAVEFRKQKIDLSEYKCVVFNSKNAADHYFRMVQEMRYNVPEETKYFCLTEAIALYLQKYIVYRKRKIFFAQSGIAELIEPFRKNREEKFLFPSSDKHSDKITEFFTNNNIKFTQGIFFRTVNSDMSAVNIMGFDMLAFFTPAGIESLFSNFPNFQQGEKQIAIFGTATLATAQSKGLRVDLAAPLPQAPSMTMAIDLFLKEFNGKANEASLAAFGPDFIKRAEPVIIPDKKGTGERSSKRKVSAKKKATVKKAPAKKAATKKAAVKKVTSKKAVAKKTETPKKTVVKKAPAKKVVEKKETPKKKAVTKKAPAKKAAVPKKETSAKKAAKKPAAAKKPVKKSGRSKKS